MADLTVQQAVAAGTVITYGAVTASDTFSNDGNTSLRVKNASGGSINVTVDAVRPCNMGFDHDLVVAVAAGAEKEIGPLSPTLYNNPATGKVTVGFSSQTSITAAAVRRLPSA